jgi:hypothetical protein
MRIASSLAGVRSILGDALKIVSLLNLDEDNDEDAN